MNRTKDEINSTQAADMHKTSITLTCLVHVQSASLQTQTLGNMQTSAQSLQTFPNICRRQNFHHVDPCRHMDELASENLQLNRLSVFIWCWYETNLLCQSIVVNFRKTSRLMLFVVVFPFKQWPSVIGCKHKGEHSSGQSKCARYSSTTGVCTNVQKNDEEAVSSMCEQLNLCGHSW